MSDLVCPFVYGRVSPPPVKGRKWVKVGIYINGLCSEITIGFVSSIK
jgi:hypothetical protein